MKKITLLFFCLVSVLTVNAEVYEGSCGTNVRYSLDTSTGVLSITGTGAMTNYSSSAYSYSPSPWYSNESYIKTVEISDGVTSIGSGAFEYCSDLTSVTIPNSVTSIGSSAFSGCSGLTSVTIGNSVTSIGSYAFRVCSGLTSIEIPNSVTSIGYGAFDGCYFEKKDFINNSSLDAEANNYWRATIIDSRNDGFVIKDGTLLKYTGNEASVTIPNSVTSIEGHAFYGCSGLTSVTIPNSVTSIGSSAFDGTAWYNNQPEGLVYAGLVAYKYKGNMPENTSITIKEGTLGIASSAFWNCSGLTSITIPNSVTSIGSSAFSGCSGLTSITIPNSVTSIGYGAFSRCSGLTSVTIGNSVTEIGGSAFSGCKGLMSIEIPNNVKTIGSSAFEGCKGLMSIEIPNSVTSIEYDAFKYCSGLTSVHITDLVAWCNISFSESGIWDEISESYHYYGYYSNPLYNAHHLFIDGKEITDLVIPDGVTSIKNGAFYGCSGLTSVTIPNSVTSIGKGAFENCTGLNNVYCYAENVPSTDSDAFSNSPISSATLSVPEISFIAYKTTSPWSGFGTINTLSGEILKCATPTIALVNDELLFSCETEDVEYEYKLTMLSPTSGTSSKVYCPSAYRVDVYATKAGYIESDVASKVIAISSDAVRGDVNGDGRVGMPDAMFIVNKMLNGKFPDEGEDTGYYWYVGQIQQYDMATKPDIIISSSNVFSEGWREINNTPDNYTSLNPLFDSNINTIEFISKDPDAPSYIYLPQPYVQAGLKMYDDDADEVTLYHDTNNSITINGIIYNEYKRTFRHTGFSGILLYKK